MSTTTVIKRCDQCQMVTINGFRTHETGCPAAWKDTKRSCFQCGCDFTPQTRFDRTCQDCRHEANDPHEED